MWPILVFPATFHAYHVAKWTQNRAPPRARALTSIVAPIRSATSLTIARPSPLPFAPAPEPRQNRSKIRFRCSAGMPGPQSSIVNTPGRRKRQRHLGSRPGVEDGVLQQIPHDRFDKPHRPPDIHDRYLRLQPHIDVSLVGQRSHGGRHIGDQSGQLYVP
jgi:hypothetical protein